MYQYIKWFHRLPVSLIATVIGLFALALPQRASAQQQADSVREQSASFVTGFVAKVNTLTLPALVINGAVEVQPMPHFSINVPIYFSGLDWFTNEVKFRTIAFQPELRYWLREDLSGIFVGVHASLAWYNIAVGGEYRYQDHSGKTPTFGAGIGVGYKIDFGPNWGMEFGIGGGVLPLRYDQYYNVWNGRLVAEDVHKTYWASPPVPAWLRASERLRDP